MNSRNKNSKNNLAKWIPIVIFLLFTNPALILPAAVFGGIFWLAYRGVQKQQGSSTTPTTQTFTRYTTRRDTFDECPQSFFCRHKDKAEHHVRRGKEIDPWDRPDIDISKYQRNR